MKIAVIGYSGSGKSTIADILGQKLNRPVLHLDRVNFLPGWQERDRRESCRIAEDFMAYNSRWVIDGNYSFMAQQARLEAADMILFLKFNRFACLWRAAKRYMKYKNTTRPSMAENCPEKLDMEFVRWVLWDGRDKEHTDSYKNIVNSHKDKVIIIKNPRRLDTFPGCVENEIIDRL